MLTVHLIVSGTALAFAMAYLSGDPGTMSSRLRAKAAEYVRDTVREIRARARVMYRRSGLYCLLGRHHPLRTALGGFRCVACGAVGADYEELGLGDSYVRPVRKLFDRATHTVTKTAAWSPSEKGEW